MQLVNPNLTVVGYPDYCLGYVERVFNIFNDPDADAWTGWLNTKFKHSDPVPKSLSVPVWFSWTGTIGGITKNWGHVAVSTPYGVYTNPLSGSGHVVFPSVQALATAYGVSYVGWSEDLQIRIVQGVDMLTPGQVDKLIKMSLDREPTAAELSDPNYQNDPGLAIDTFWNNGGEANYKNPPAPNATVLKPGTYKVN